MLALRNFIDFAGLYFWKSHLFSDMYKIRELREN